MPGKWRRRAVFLWKWLWMRGLREVATLEKECEQSLKGCDCASIDCERALKDCDCASIACERPLKGCDCASIACERELKGCDCASIACTGPLKACDRALIDGKSALQRCAERFPQGGGEAGGGGFIRGGRAAAFPAAVGAADAGQSSDLGSLRASSRVLIRLVRRGRRRRLARSFMSSR